MKPSPEVSAWRKWEKESARSLDVTSLKAPADQAQYLRNRLELCFQDGVEAGKRMERARLTTRPEDWPLSFKAGFPGVKAQALMDSKTALPVE